MLKSTFSVGAWRGHQSHGPGDQDGIQAFGERKQGHTLSAKLILVFAGHQAPSGQELAAVFAGLRPLN